MQRQVASTQPPCNRGEYLGKYFAAPIRAQPPRPAGSSFARRGAGKGSPLSPRIQRFQWLAARLESAPIFFATAFIVCDRLSRRSADNLATAVSHALGAWQRNIFHFFLAPCGRPRPSYLHRAPRAPTLREEGRFHTQDRRMALGRRLRLGGKSLKAGSGSPPSGTPRHVA